MKVEINQITPHHTTPRKENGEVTSIQVHFTARTADGNINLNGNIPIEDFSEQIDFEGIESEVRQELVNRIMNGEVSAE